MKILVIFTGGTIGSATDEGIIAPQSSRKKLLIEMYNQKNDNQIQFDVAQPYYALSENNTGKTLSMLISAVCDAMADDYDGVIVTHGTDTLQYSACAVSYALGSNSKPVMFVSSNYVLTDKRANGIDNFSAGVDFIKGGYGKGVFVPYKNSDGKVYIHRASRLLQHSELSDDVFSINNQYYGSYNGETFIKNPDYKSKNDEIAPFGKIQLPDFCNKVLLISAYTGLPYPDIDCTVRAVLIKTYHSGTICTDNKEFYDFAKSLIDKNIHCFICGAKSGDLYESAKVFKEYNFRILPPASFISQYIKSWIAYSNDVEFDDICNKSLGEDLI